MSASTPEPGNKEARTSNGGGGTIVEANLSLFSPGQIRVVRSAARKGTDCPQEGVEGLAAMWHAGLDKLSALQAVVRIGDVPDSVFEVFMFELENSAHVRSPQHAATCCCQRHSAAGDLTTDCSPRGCPPCKVNAR